MKRRRIDCFSICCATRSVSPVLRKAAAQEIAAHADFSIDGRYAIFTCEYAKSIAKIDLVERKVAGYLKFSKGGMAATDFGRPIVAPPGVPSDRLNLLREAFLKTMKDPELLAEAKRKNFDITPSTGEELERLAKLVMNQPQEVVARVKILMEQ